ncbi:hypothetical protein [Herbaspirillum sp. ST 5-3]|uniref:hypothetical protein n=1 Tax=Oxalobacteraceae TaxID=75682 RepID=UPI0010A56D11|nr:hypothetical protein [Herbaspirillum sp. ST 5-3]
MKIRRVFARVVLAFLLLSQQLGITHAISHISSDTSSSRSRDKELPAELQCVQCLAFASIGSGLTGSPLQLDPLPAPADTITFVLLVKPLPAALRAFDSRAPPLFV